MGQSATSHAWLEIKEAANWGGRHADQVRREALGIPAQSLPFTRNGWVCVAVRPVEACIKILTKFPGTNSKEFTSTT